MQRTVNGVRLPTRAEVGIRVWDGKVGWYLFSHQPVTANLTGLLDREAARAAIVRALPAGRKVAAWLEERCEVVTDLPGPAPSQPRRKVEPTVVWTVTFEVPTGLRGPIDAPPTPIKPGEREQIRQLLEGTVDAHTGALLARSSQEVNRERYAWYVAHGGTSEAPFPIVPSPLYGDSAPRFSPDSRRLAFLSTRPREGYPVWMDRPTGLFVCDVDGRNLVCVEPAAVRSPAWSPDGGSLVYEQGGRLVIRELATGRRQEIAPGVVPGLQLNREGQPYPGQGFRMVCWPAAGRLVAVGGGLAGAGSLLVVDLASPTAKLEALPLPAPEEVPMMAPPGTKPRPQAQVVAALGARDGQALMMTEPQGIRITGRMAPCRLWSFDPTQEQPAFKQLADKLPQRRGIGPGPDGKVHLWDGDDTSTSRTLWSAEKGAEDLLLEGLTTYPGFGRDMKLPHLAFSPDGKLTASVWYHWSGQPGDPGARVLHVGGPDLTQPHRPLLPSPAELPTVLGR